MKAFAKTFATEFKVADGFERLKFAGRTDIGLVREFFSFHQIEPTPENFERFFERYVFWLDQILRESQTEVCPGVWEFIRELQPLPQPPLLGLLTGNIRLGAEIKLRHFNLWDVFQTGGVRRRPRRSRPDCRRGACSAAAASSGRTCAATRCVVDRGYAP